MSSHDLNHTLRHAGQSWLLCRGNHRLRETAEVLNEENLTAAYAIPFQRVEVAGHICSSRHSSTQLSCHYIDKQAKLLR